MRNVSPRRAISLLAVGLLLAGLSVGLYANHSWRSYHWPRTGPSFTLDLGDNVSSTWDAHLATTSADWSVSNVLDTNVVQSGKDPKKCEPTAGRVEVCNAWYGYRGWLGVAQIWVDGDHIVQGTTKLNDSYFSSTTYNTPAWRNLVMCQEVGHTFGLGHQDENFYNTNLGSCMDYTSNPEGPPTNEHPNAHDYDQLETIYAHADGGDSEPPPPRGKGRNKLPPAMNDIDFEGPGQWGRLVSGSRQHGFSIYELDFGGGRKIITHVLWVRPGRE